jgi:hypothetical protein
MNVIINDFGKQVIAVGAPGSYERIKCTYPSLIQYLYKVKSLTKALSYLGAVIPTNLLTDTEKEHLLRAAGYGV